MTLSKTLYPLTSANPGGEDLSQHDLKIVGWDIKDQTKKLQICSIILWNIMGMRLQPVRWGLQYDAADSTCTRGCFRHFYVGYWLSYTENSKFEVTMTSA